MEKNIERIGKFNRTIKLSDLSAWGSVDEKIKRIFGSNDLFYEDPEEAKCDFSNSKEISIGQLAWYIGCWKRDHRLVFVFAVEECCDVEAHVDIRIKSQKAGVRDIIRDESVLSKKYFTCDEHKFVFYETNVADFDDYIVNGQIEFEVSIKVLYVSEVRNYEIDFSKPTKLSDVVVVVEENKIHLNKTFLSMHSTYFEELFSDNEEKEGNEYEIKDDYRHHMNELMRFIYPSAHLLIDEKCIYNSMESAQNFDLQHVIHSVADVLLTSESAKLYILEMFRIADKYKLADLHSHSLKLMSTEDIGELLIKDCYKNISVDSIHALGERLSNWRLTQENETTDDDDDNEKSILSKKGQDTYVITLPSNSQSSLFYIKNVPWSVKVKEIYDEELDQSCFEINLACNNNNISPFWNVKGSIKTRIYSKSEKIEDLVQTGDVCFDSKNSSFKSKSARIDSFASYKSEDMIKLEVSIQMEKVVGIGGYAVDFSKPTKYSDVILVVEGKNLHVNRTYLAIHSPYFEVMFFSDFKERNEAEVELKDVNYESFKDIMSLIYPQAGVRIRDDNVIEFLVLADRFDIPRVVYLCERYLMKTSKMDNYQKFGIAEQYSLSKLQSQILRSWQREDILILQDREEFQYLNLESLKRIIGRLLNL